MKLVWKRRGAGLGIFADGVEHRYYIYRMSGRSPWVVKIARLIDVGGVKVAATTGAQYDEHHSTQAIVKAIAQAFEDDADAAEKPSQNRLTRAVNAGYRNPA